VITQNRQFNVQGAAPRLRKEGWSLAGIGLAYFCATGLALQVPDSARVLAALWPVGGIGLAALLLTPQRRWRSVLAVLFVAGNAAGLCCGRHLLPSLGFMAVNLLESAGSAWLICRRGKNPVNFNSVAQARKLLAAGTLVNGLTAFVGAGVAALSSGAPFWGCYRVWWIADGLGILLVAPVIVAWARPDGVRVADRARWGLELLAIAAVTGILAWHYFGPRHNRWLIVPYSYMLIIPLVWGALRVGARGVLTVQMVLAVVALSMTLGAGAKSPLGGSNEAERLLWVQVFLGVSSSIALLLAASFVELQSTEQSLREVDASLRSLGDNLPNGVVHQLVMETDGTLHYLYLSAGLQRLNGLSPEAVIQDASLFFRQIVPEDLPKVMAARDSSLAAMSVFNVVFRLRRADGQLRWMHLCSAPRRLPDGRIIWDGIETDITEEREAGEALRESEGRYRALVEYAPIGITVSVNDLIVYANQEAAKIVGAPDPAAIVGHHTRDFVPEKLWDEIAARRQTMMATGIPAPPLRRRLRRLDNLMIDVEGRSSPITHEGKPAIQTLLVDISEEKRSEDLIRRQLTFDKVIKDLLVRIVSSPGSRLDSEIQEGLRELATFMNVCRAFITVNPPGEKTWSITHEWTAPGIRSHIQKYQKIPLGLFPSIEEALLAGRVFQMNHLEDLTPGESHLREKLEAGGFKALIQLPFWGQDGTVTGSMGFLSTSPENWQEVDVQRLQTAANAMAHAIERQRADEHLKKSREQLRALSARLQTLREEERTRIAREIHDHLGQLLTALSLDIGLIERKLGDVKEPAARAALHSKLASARSLVDETIISVQKIAAELRPVALDRLGLEAALETEAAAFSARTGIVCQVRVSGLAGPAPMDSATACFRIFQEILTNVARHAKANAVMVSLRRGEEQVLMQVTDDGIGIQHDDLEDPKSLGLLGMIERAEMLGGSTKFERVDPHGTTVTVRIPLPRKAGQTA